MSNGNYKTAIITSGSRGLGRNAAWANKKEKQNDKAENPRR
jgi:hypothetical protein